MSSQFMMGVAFRSSRNDHGLDESGLIYELVDAGGANSVYTVYAPCGAAGSAMYDPESREYKIGPLENIGDVTKPHCWLMYAPPIVIHGDYMSVQQGMMHVNMVHRTSNFTPPVPTQLALNGNIKSSRTG